MRKLVLPNGSSKYGAQMGRANVLPHDCAGPIKLQMQKLKWVNGDYDEKGCYWGGGSGDNIYCAWNDDARVFVRAFTRQQAKCEVWCFFPHARFYN